MRARMIYRLCRVEKLMGEHQAAIEDGPVVRRHCPYQIDPDRQVSFG
jgi:hypothetical protein